MNFTPHTCCIYISVFWITLGFRLFGPLTHTLIPWDQIDLVLTDSSMPGMEGVELLQEIFDINPDSKAILLSGYIPELPDTLKKHKTLSVLQKPVQQEELEEAIRVLLD